jgi:hypothetical protein
MYGDYSQSTGDPLMDAHLRRRDVEAQPLQQDRRPSASAPKYVDGADVLCAMKVHGLGYLVIRVKSTKRSDGRAELRLSTFTDDEVKL